VLLEELSLEEFEEAQPLPPDLMANAIADVRDHAGQCHHCSNVPNTANDLNEVHIWAARRNRTRPIAVNRMFGIHAHSAASATNASAMNEQIVITT